PLGAYRNLLGKLTEKENGGKQTGKKTGPETARERLSMTGQEEAGRGARRAPLRFGLAGALDQVIDRERSRGVNRHIFVEVPLVDPVRGLGQPRRRIPRTAVSHLDVHHHAVRVEALLVLVVVLPA